MKIAIVHDWIITYAGSERVVAELLKIYPDADLYTAIYNPEMSKWFGDRKIYTTFLQRLWEHGFSHQKLYPLMPMAFGMLDLSEYDLVISSSHAASKGIYTRSNAKHICYCHTPTRYLWSHQEEYISYESNNKYKRLFLRAIIRRMCEWDYDAAQRVDFFIANSNEVKNRIAKYYKRNSIVVNPPFSIDIINRVNQDRSDYYIMIGRLVSYKRVDVAIKAFNQLNKKLIIIGSGEECGNLSAFACSNIKFMGEVSEDEKVLMLSNARALIFCAEEDFGIVPVEALALGTPVIAFDKGGVRDSIIHLYNGILFDKQDEESLMNAVYEFEKAIFNYDRIVESSKKFTALRFRTEIKKIITNIKGDNNEE
jgi:glycosyltransferase involved in cell wall biosynthesis